VDDCIVSISFEPNARKFPMHPQVERIMQEQVGKQRTDHALNAKGNFRFEREVRDWRSGFLLDLRRKR
jgi:hypothetical protein